MNLNNKKLFVAVLGVVFLIIILGSVDLSSNADKQLAAARAAKDKSGPQKSARPSNMMIRGNGEVQLSGITVESNDGGQLVTVGTFDQVITDIFINTDDKTKVFAGASGTGVEALTPGAVLTISGSLESLSPHLTIVAKEIRAFGVVDPQAKSALMRLRNVPELPAKKMLAVADLPGTDTASFLSSVINDLFELKATTSDAGDVDTATSTDSDSATSTATSTIDSVATTTDSSATSTEPMVEPEASSTDPVIEEPVEESEEETSTTTQPVELEPSE